MPSLWVNEQGPSRLHMALITNHVPKRLFYLKLLERLVYPHRKPLILLGPRSLTAPEN